MSRQLQMGSDTVNQGTYPVARCFNGRNKYCYGDHSLEPMQTRMRSYSATGRDSEGVNIALSLSPSCENNMLCPSIVNSLISFKQGDARQDDEQGDARQDDEQGDARQANKQGVARQDHKQGDARQDCN
jgi:hypothetical protein